MPQCIRETFNFWKKLRANSHINPFTDPQRKEDISTMQHGYNKNK